MKRWFAFLDFVRRMARGGGGAWREWVVVARGVASAAFRPDVPFPPSQAPFFYGWVVLGAATLGIVASIPGQTMGVSVFTDILIHELGLTRVQLSLAYLVGTAASGILVPFGGRLFDRWGARQTMVVAALVFGFFLALMSSCDLLAEGFTALVGGTGAVVVAILVVGAGFLAIRFLGQGMLTIASRAMLGKWFDRRRGLAFAINGVAVSFAFSVAPKFLDFLIGMFGWRGAYLFLGFGVGLGMSLVAWALFRDNPEECGLEMDGGVVDTSGQRHAAPKVVREWELGEALRTLPFWAFNLGTAFFALLTTAYTFHVVSIGGYAGIGKDAILSLFIPAAFVGIGANFFSGWLSDRVQIKWVLFTLQLALACCALGMLLLSTAPGRILLIAGIGTAGGCFQTCIGVAWPRFFGRRHLGAISGFNMSTIVTASALGPFLFSLSEKFAGNYAPAYLAGVAVSAVLLVGSLSADNPQRKG